MAPDDEYGKIRKRLAGDGRVFVQPSENAGAYDRSFPSTGLEKRFKDLKRSWNL